LCAAVLGLAVGLPAWAVLTPNRAVVSAVGLAGGAVTASAAPIGRCPTHIYLGNDPHGTDLPDWSENAQGLANDGHHWFFTQRTRLFKYDANWVPIDGFDGGRLADTGFPPELAAIGIDHFGDPDYHAGYVFVPFEGPSHTVIAAFRAFDLAFVDWVDVHARQTRAGWVAIDPVEEVLYTSHDRIVAGTPLLRYAIEIDKIDNGVIGDFLTPTAQRALLAADGSPLSGIFIYLQGGVFTPWGDLYLSVGKAGDSPEDTRGGLHLFRRTADGQGFQLVESSVNVSGHVGDPVFAYEYHPGSTGLGEEPEGIDWWNRDNAPGSPYNSQLHAILLDNQVGDDQIWLKHYNVDYGCVGNADSDGDGLTDRDEVYVHGTHPRLSDSDGDGQSDGAEIACGSDPRDAGSRSSDGDGDAIPDCVDADDDNDGVVDAADRCAGTVIPDRVIPSTGTLKHNRFALLDGDLVFDGGNPAPPYTVVMTGGCNATQIADRMGLGVSHYESGITRGVLDTWIAMGQ
jgi:hypothetical protein